VDIMFQKEYPTPNGVVGVVSHPRAGLLWDEVSMFTVPSDLAATETARRAKAASRDERHNGTRSLRTSKPSLDLEIWQRRVKHMLTLNGALSCCTSECIHTTCLIWCHCCIGWLVKGGDVFSDDEPTSSIPQSLQASTILLQLLNTSQPLPQQLARIAFLPLKNLNSTSNQPSSCLSRIEPRLSCRSSTKR
jgi:hypothetical protein